MSDRSAAWYADPANRDRRRPNMSAYSAAMTALARRHPAERHSVYARERDLGASVKMAGNRALAAVRDAHRAEFESIRAAAAGKTIRQPWTTDTAATA